MVGGTFFETISAGEGSVRGGTLLHPAPSADATLRYCGCRCCGEVWGYGLDHRTKVERDDLSLFRLAVVVENVIERKPEAFQNDVGSGVGIGRDPISVAALDGLDSSRDVATRLHSHANPATPVLVFLADRLGPLQGDATSRQRCLTSLFGKQIVKQARPLFCPFPVFSFSPSGLHCLSP